MPERTHPRLLLSIVAVLAIMVLAFVVRLVPVLNGGGLFGFGNYDDGVYYAAADGLVHGRLPYRDFLLLHPPGIVLALSPFALLGSLTRDATGFAVARLAWMASGAVCSALVVLICRRYGRYAALLGGLAYALYAPAVYGELSTLLEAPANLALLLCLLVISGRPDRRALQEEPSLGRRPWLWGVAGALLALSPLIKIWGVVAAAVVLVWVLLRFGARPLLLILAGMAGAALLVLGPFFAAAPGAMWRLVVIDQLGRPSGAGNDLAVRLHDLAGVGSFKAPTLLFVLAALWWLIALVLTCWSRDGRFYTALHLVLCTFLLVSPSWFMHYATYAAPSAALVVGAAAGVVARRVSETPEPRPAVRVPALLAAVGAPVVMLGISIPLLGFSFGRTYPHKTVAASVADVPGCVTADDPINLIQLNVLSRNLDRGCRLVADLGGYGYDLRPDGRSVSRLRNPLWQREALDYMASGDRAVFSRFNRASTLSFDKASLAELRSWPLQAGTSRVSVRTPPR